MFFADSQILEHCRPERDTPLQLHSPGKVLRYVISSTVIVQQDGNADGYDSDLLAMDVATQAPLLVVATAERHICIFHLGKHTRIVPCLVPSSTNSLLSLTLMPPPPPSANPGQLAKPQFLSPLRMQTRTISCFPDGTGYTIGSVEGRVAVQYVNDPAPGASTTAPGAPPTVSSRHRSPPPLGHQLTQIPTAAARSPRTTTRSSATGRTRPRSGSASRRRTSTRSTRQSSTPSAPSHPQEETASSSAQSPLLSRVFRLSADRAPPCSQHLGPPGTHAR